jgi:hypothetical protein
MGVWSVCMCMCVCDALHTLCVFACVYKYVLSYVRVCMGRAASICVCVCVKMYILHIVSECVYAHIYVLFMYVVCE